MNWKHHNDIKKKGKIKRFLLFIFFLIFLSIMIITGRKIYEWILENRDSDNIMQNIKDTISIDVNIDSVDKYNIDFNSLNQINSDIIAWIKVNGTEIEYPIVKTTNNDFYMVHSLDKSYNSAGWVFMDCRNKFDGTDKNMVIFAHNRRNSSMFGTLKNILTEDWQNNEENFKIPFITENEKSEYQVFSIYKIKSEDFYITTNFETDDEFQNFITTVKSRSVKNFDVEVGTTDSILTLSTCADNNKYRVVLHAKK